MFDRNSRTAIVAIAAMLCMSAPVVARQDHQEAPRDQWQRVTEVFDAMGLGRGLS
jgi:hypothetical protein